MGYPSQFADRLRLESAEGRSITSKSPTYPIIKKNPYGKNVPQRTGLKSGDNIPTSSLGSKWEEGIMVWKHDLHLTMFI